MLRLRGYLVFVEDEPPYEEPLPLVEPLELELGEVVPDELGRLDEPELELGEELEELPEAPDLLKYASHSERETLPSLFVSASEKFGEDMLLEEPLAEEGRDDDEDDGLVDDGLVDDDPVELEPDTDGVEDEGLVVDEDEDCATASDESAKSTAAVVMLRVLGMSEASCGGGNSPQPVASAMPMRPARNSSLQRNARARGRHL